MSANVSRLKKQAAELEQKRQPDKALAKYVQVLDALGDQHLDEADIALYNRVGDLLMRQSKVGEALEYYEKAVDHYTDGGFFNNAIALCNKILRNAPGRTSVYYKLGRISARKGFVADAKQNFLEYADRMQRSGQLEAAFKALAEFAELCPDQEDIRLMLADQLAKSDRKGEAIEQLQRLYEKMESEGRGREARATADRMRAIDPDVAPRAPVSTPVPKARDLVFLEVDYDAPNARHQTAAKGRGTPPRSSTATTPAADLPLIPTQVSAAAGDAAAAPTAHEPLSPDAVLHSDGSTTIEGLQAGAFNGSSEVPGLEHTVLPVGDDGTQMPVAGLSHSMIDDLGIGDDAAIAPSDLVDPHAAVEPDDGTPAGAPPLETVADDDRLDGGLVVDHGPPNADDYGMIEFDATATTGGERLVPLAEPAWGGKIEIRNDQSALLESDAAAEDAPAGSAPAADEADPTVLESLIEIDLDDDQHALPATGMVPESASADAAAGPETGDEASGPLPLIEPLAVDHSAYGFDLPQPWEPAEESGSEDYRDGSSEDSGLLHQAHAEDDEDIDPIRRLQRAVADAPTDADVRRRLGEALIEIGDREGGIAVLEESMGLHEERQDFAAARSVVDEILRLEPNSIRHHQKRVEFAFRIGDRPRLVDAYLELADSLFRSGHADKCRAVLERVTELAPEDRRAREYMRAIDPALVTPIDDVQVVAAEPVAPPAAPAEDLPDATAEEFVNLAEWLAEESVERSTRMVADVAEPEDGEDVDFRRMLDMFKQGVAQNVEEEDHESHYDLGVAYKEMGLLDEAIAEFQKALRGTEDRVRTYEALGQCFVEKEQHQVALSILSRATADHRYTEDVLVGVLYLLGVAHEALGEREEARSCFERVVAVDIDFRDARERLDAVQGHA